MVNAVKNLYHSHHHILYHHLSSISALLSSSSSSGDNIHHGLGHIGQTKWNRSQLLQTRNKMTIFWCRLVNVLGKGVLMIRLGKNLFKEPGQDQWWRRNRSRENTPSQKPGDEMDNVMFFLLVSWFETPNRTVLSHDLQEMPTMMIMFSMMKITGSPKRGRSPLCSSGKRARLAAQSEASRMKSQTALMSLICILIIDIITDDNRDDGWLYCVTVLWYSPGWSFWYEIAQH